MNTHTDPPQTDHSWDNRRLILASLAPRATTRPARRITTRAAEDTAEGPDIAAAPKKPGLAARGFHATGRALRAGHQQFDKRIPRENRLRLTVITAAAIAILGVALAGVNYLSTDVNPPAQPTAKASPQPPMPSKAPLRKTTVLTGVTATDMCAHDDAYSETNRAFDGDFSTAWNCTRAKNKDGQVLQVDFGRQVTIEQVRLMSGVWDNHNVVTAIEVWFPKDLQRAPATLKTADPKDWRGITLSPPATLSKLLIRVAETSDPQPPTTPTPERAQQAPDDVSTVAISDIQFIGTTATTAS